MRLNRFYHMYNSYYLSGYVCKMHLLGSHQTGTYLSNTKVGMRTRCIRNLPRRCRYLGDIF